MVSIHVSVLCFYLSLLLLRLLVFTVKEEGGGINCVVHGNMEAYFRGGLLVTY